MASEHANAQIRLLKELIKEAVEEEYSILLERPERRSNLIEGEDVIEEGVFDDGVLKAVFTAGGPGSGKSFLADVIFGVRDSSGKPYFGNASFLGKTGLKYVNSDKFFEKQLKDNNIDPGDLQRIEKEDPKLWNKIQGASPNSLRNIAKGKLNMLKGFFESGRIGMLVDGTGGKYDKMVRQKETAEALGYDTMLLFVDTSEEIAVERNANRERKLPEEKVRELWSDVQNNKEGFQNLFGDKMVIVNNDKFGPPPEDVVKQLNKFVDAPVQNKIGQVWIEDELEMRGVQTLEPGGASGFRGSKQAADRIQQMRDTRGEVD
jgi:predicted kinase